MIEFSFHIHMDECELDYTPEDLEEVLLKTRYDVFDINKIIDKFQLSIGVIYKFRNQIDWYKFTCCQEITNEVMDSFGSFLDWDLILQSQQFSEYDLEQYVIPNGAPLDTICETQKLSEKFIDKYGFLSECSSTVLERQEVSIAYIEKNFEQFDRMDFESLIKSRNLPDDMIIRIAKLIGWNGVANKHLSEDFIIKHLNEFELTPGFFGSIHLTDHILEAVIEFSKQKSLGYYLKLMETLSGSVGISIDFISAHFEDLNLSLLKKNWKIDREKLSALLKQHDLIREVSNA